MQETKIEWCRSDDGTPGATWNPVRGCTKVSEGCKFCYAMGIAARFSGKGQPFEGLGMMTPAGPQWTNQVRTLPEKLTEPLSWKKPRRIFVNSVSDLFHKDVPFDFIDKVFAVMALCPQHTFQVLTKRPERMAEYLTRLYGEEGVGWIPGAETFHSVADAALLLSEDAGTRPESFWEHVGKIEARDHQWPLPNVWLGTSVENQAAADERIPHLLRCPAAVRFLSCEPLLGPVEFSNVTRRSDAVSQLGKKALSGIHWVIVGGESGKDSRPMHPDWARSIRDQCDATGVPFFFKQWGNWTETDFPTFGDAEVSPGVWMRNVGKHAAGRLLDGRTHDAFPAATGAARGEEGKTDD